MRKKAKLESQGERQWGTSAPSPGSAEPSVPSELKNPKPTPKHAPTLPSLPPPEKNWGRKSSFWNNCVRGSHPAALFFFFKSSVCGERRPRSGPKIQSYGVGAPHGDPPGPVLPLPTPPHPRTPPGWGQGHFLVSFCPEHGSREIQRCTHPASSPC